jgi:hypothetical protein
MPLSRSQYLKAAGVIGLGVAALIWLGTGFPSRAGFAVQIRPWEIARTVAEPAGRPDAWLVYCEERIADCLLRARALCRQGFDEQEMSLDKGTFVQFSKGLWRSGSVNLYLNRKAEVQCAA